MDGSLAPILRAFRILSHVTSHHAMALTLTLNLNPIRSEIFRSKQSAQQNTSGSATFDSSATMVTTAGDDALTRRHRRPTGLALTIEQGNNEDPHHEGDKFKANANANVKTKKKRRRVKSDQGYNNNTEEPFLVLVFKVGVTLAVLSLCCFHTFRLIYPYTPPPDVSAYDDDDGNGNDAGGGGLPVENVNHKNQIQTAETDTLKLHGHGASSEKDDDDKLNLHVSGLLGNLADPEASSSSSSSSSSSKAAEMETPPPLPVWELGTASQFDAYSIAAKYQQDVSNNNNKDNNNKNMSNATAFWRAAHGLRRKFSEYYGGENAARALLERGLSTGGSLTMTMTSNHISNNLNNSNSNYSNYSNSNNNWTVAADVPRDLHDTACRMHEAQIQNRPFRMAFGGYSVTVGRGNYFEQSFPLVMEKHLHTVFSLLGLELQVKNAAIGGCPALPYGWCMSNFWGKDADVVSWDYSMNEAGGIPEGLEAYLRHTLQLPRKPALIVKDTHMADGRRNLLQRYFEMSTDKTNEENPTVRHVRDFVVIHTDPAVKPFLDRPEEHRPAGFKEWRKFGSPPGAPGQALHHPAVKEHELIAWMLTMHFLRALELLASSRQDPSLLQCRVEQKDTLFLPRPVAKEATSITATRPWTSILFGEQESNSSRRWQMNPVHCRTSFEPIISGDLSSIAVSGTVGEDLDIMLPKSKMFYNRHWVLDLSDGEKQAKRKLDIFGGLGYVDSKKAYYGIFPSGTLRFLLPYESTSTSTSTSSQASTVTRMPALGDKATDWFKSIVVCEVNEKRDAGACQTEKDVSLIVGGANVTDAVMMDAAGTLYLGKKLCLYVPVPSDAILTSRIELKKNETIKLLLPLEKFDEARDAEVGLALELSINNRHILNRDQACSVSHVVWEQQRMP